MKKLIILLLLVMFSKGVFSQSRFEMGFTGSKNFNNFTENYHESSFWKSNEYSIGLKTAYNVNAKAALQLGILYNRMVFGQAATFGWCATPPLTWYYLNIKTENIEIQSSFRYTFFSVKKISPFAFVGISQFIKTRDVTGNKMDSEPFVNNMGVNSPNYNIAIISSLGLRFTINQTFAIDFEPQVKYFLLQNTIYKNHISFGCGMTFSYKF